MGAMEIQDLILLVLVMAIPVTLLASATVVIVRLAISGPAEPPPAMRRAAAGKR